LQDGLYCSPFSPNVSQDFKSLVKDSINSSRTAEQRQGTKVLGLQKDEDLLAKNRRGCLPIQLRPAILIKDKAI
jgi:hypothetical protein